MGFANSLTRHMGGSCGPTSTVAPHPTFSVPSQFLFLCFTRPEICGHVESSVIPVHDCPHPMVGTLGQPLTKESLLLESCVLQSVLQGEASRAEWHGQH